MDMEIILFRFLQVVAVHLFVNKLSNVINLNSNLNELEIKLKRLSCRAYDMKKRVTQEEQTGKQRRRNQKRKRTRKSEVDNWFREVQLVENKFSDLKNTTQHRGIWRNSFSVATVLELDERVEQLMEQSRHFESLTIYEPETRKKLFEDVLEQRSKTILRWLTVSNFSKIVIHGSRGVGKTTLAEHICCLLKESNFSVCWFNVSQKFDKVGLQNKIANELGCDLSDVDEEEVRADKLREALDKMAERLVIILDGVLEEFCLDNVGIALGEKCRLIWTTRSEELCEIMESEAKFKVKKLDIDQAWDLFQHTLGLETVLSQEVEKTAKLVARRCAGLPLGIIIVAGNMKGVIGIREWTNALEQLKTSQIGTKEMKDEVFSILNWSFDRLNRRERLCFLFCCTHLNDCGMPRKELINLFVSEKLIPKRAFGHAQNILKKLINVCLLRGDEHMTMHGSIRYTGITLGKSLEMC